MNNELIQSCVDHLLVNFGELTLLDYADDDDGANTIYEYDCTYSVDIIEQALAIIVKQLT